MLIKYKYNVLYTHHSLIKTNNKEQKYNMIIIISSLICNYLAKKHDTINSILVGIINITRVHKNTL